MRYVLEIARQTFLLQARSRLYWIVLALSAAVAGVFLLVPARRVSGAEMFGGASFFMSFALVLPFIILYLAVYAVHGDIEDRTSVYLFTRPVRRIWILLGKWLAVVGLGAGFALVSVTSLYLVIAHTGRAWQDGAVPSFADYSAVLGGALLSVAGYAATGVLFGAFFRKPMLVSMFYIVVQEFAARLPPQAGIHSITVADPVRRFVADNLSYSGRDIREMFTARFSGSEGLELLSADPLVSLLKLVGVTLVLAMWIYSRREYDARPPE